MSLEKPPSGQPQPSQWERDEQESRDSLARGEGVTFENAEQAIQWLQEPEQGQPQQEPAFADLAGTEPGGRYSGAWDAQQGRQAGVHSLLQLVNSGVVAGALFDFLGWLTSRDEEVTFSGHHEAGIAVRLLQEWAEKRGLSLDNADVMYWQQGVADAAAQAKER